MSVCNELKSHRGTKLNTTQERKYAHSAVRNVPSFPVVESANPLRLMLAEGRKEDASSSPVWGSQTRHAAENKVLLPASVQARLSLSVTQMFPSLPFV